ncbi:threonine-phosphate decarboxylase CobD [Metallumcola ferriviriculae]|uniref:threonine-phosphate decarboxylase n=1 Tax=Metallumcola ferriviriculae TaxID=3039180 RepID=A0AAU0UNM4_9FIRM|nr:threonine-phosphate decarboxylase CobD [Desulfitibacteraceae bacterium MK1]
MTGNVLRKHGGNIRAVVSRYGAREYLDFSANINPLGLVSGVAKALRKGLDEIVHYPEPEDDALSHAISKFLGVRQQMVMCGNGASELIYLVARLKQVKRAVIPQPTFSEYQLAAEAAQVPIVLPNLAAAQGFQFTMQLLKEKLTAGDMLFLCNPNNPVGNVIPLREMINVIEFCEAHGVTVVVDESFRDFVSNMPSVIPYAAQYKCLVVIYSMTKFFALPGLRLGCAVADPQIMDEIKELRDPWSVNVLAQIAGKQALQEKNYIIRSKKLVETEKEYLFGGLKEVPGLQPYYPAANYIFVDVSGTGLASTALRKLLINEGIVIRDCSTYPTLNTGYIRVAVRLREENHTLLCALNKVLRDPAKVQLPEGDIQRSNAEHKNSWQSRNEIGADKG